MRRSNTTPWFSVTAIAIIACFVFSTTILGQAKQEHSATSALQISELPEQIEALPAQGSDKQLPTPWMVVAGASEEIVLRSQPAASVVLGATRCPGNAAYVKYHALRLSHIGVSVKINGSGPYEFLFDTGAEITIIDPSLAKKLNLESTGALPMATVTSLFQAPLVSARLVEVGDARVSGMQMAVEDLGSIQAEYPGLRGIIGNNFLSRFDLLIDNSHKTLCFDDSGRMQQSLHGERLPILSHGAPNSSSASAEPILVSVQLPGDGKQGSVLRVDSGSNVPLLFLDRQLGALPLAQRTLVQGSTFGKGGPFFYVYTPQRSVKLGSQKEMQISFATPVSSEHLYSKTVEDGLLPTTLFKRVFISTSNRFVMFDPR